MEKRSAVEEFKSGLNCSQAVLGHYAEDNGLSLEPALRMAAGFGGGIGRTGGVCGAVSGAIMAIGLMSPASNPRDTAAKSQIYGLVRSFLEEFAARNGSTLCRELLGCDISTPEGYELAAGQGLFHTRCPQYVQDAIDILDDMF
jgi:C_GCAxxG_C_C family probable redox protein